MRPVLRRGLSRTDAAVYIGLSPSKFDELVNDGRMPKPIAIDSRKVWDRHELDAAFDAFPRDDDLGGGWEDFSVDPGRGS
jgi:predicted DNA-binding transcriptional regulator AlpA